MEYERQARTKGWFSLFLTIAGLGGLIYYLFASTEWHRLKLVSTSLIALISLITLAQLVFSAMKFSLSAKLFKVSISVRESVMLSTASSLINVLPFVGIGFRALYLKKVHKLKYTDFMLSLMLDLATNFIMGGFIALICVFLLRDKLKDFYVELILLFSIYSVGPFIPFTLAALWGNPGSSVGMKLRLLGWSSRVRGLLNSFLLGLDVLLSHPLTILSFAVINLILGISVGLSFSLIGIGLGYGVDLVSALLLRGINMVIMITPLPNGTIGLREATTGIGTMIIGTEAIVGVMISAVERAVSLMWIILIGGVSLLLLRRRMQQSETSAQQTVEDRIKQDALTD